MFSKKRLVVTAVLTAFIATGCALSSGSVSEESLGLRNTNLYTEDKTVGDKTDYSTAVAGKSKVYKRAFENAPPMISHDIEGMLPITASSNTCLACHDPEVAPSFEATAIPRSHLFDMRTETMLDTVSNTRYSCTQCHAPQSDNKPLVKNIFEPEFRTSDGDKQSNLLDNLNEGVQ